MTKACLIKIKLVEVKYQLVDIYNFRKWVEKYTVSF